MTTSRTQISCPQCGMPIAAEIQQVFDLTTDPTAKQKLLTGQFNIAQCPQCGYHGNLSTPMVYHDLEKELLLTFIPPNLNLPRDEQERTIGKLINQVIDALPQEQRKGYLFSPQPNFTLQSMIELILEKDGVTKEMLDKQKERMELLQRIATIADEEALEVVVKEEDKNIDEDFFRLISQLIEASMTQGDQQGAQQLGALQQTLLPLTTVGKELQAQSQEVETALSTLQEEGQDLTRERLLELVLEAPNETRINAYASLARAGMDYEFFQQLSLKIEAAEGEEKTRLESIREQLLQATHEIDEQLAQRLEIASKNIDMLLDANTEDIKNITMQNIQVIDDSFMQALEQKYQAAKEANELDIVQKIEVVIETLQEASQAAQQQAGPDPMFVQSLLDAEDDAREALMQENAERIDEKLVEMLTGLMMQLNQQTEASPEQKDLAEKVRKTYRLAVRMSMTANMNKGKE